MMRFSVKITQVEGAIERPAENAADRWHRREGLLLELTANGVTGLGEASPLPGVSPDSLDEARHVLQVAATLLDVDPSTTVQGAFDRIGQMIAIEAPAARFALETAVLDWLGRSRAKPVHALLGCTDARALSLAALIDAPCGDWDREVDRAVHASHDVVKLKVGHDFSSELKSLEALRRAHPDIGLRLDANRTLPLAELQAASKTLKALGLEFFEEPVPTTDLEQAAGLDVPLALDESLQSLSRPGLAKLASFEALVAVVLKPTVVGGFAHCTELAGWAAGHGLGVVLSHALEGPVARAAAGELALSLESAVSPGLGPHPGLSLWPPVDGACIEGSTVRTHDAFGLGFPSFEVDGV